MKHSQNTKIFTTDVPTITKPLVLATSAEGKKGGGRLARASTRNDSRRPTAVAAASKGIYVSTMCLNSVQFRNFGTQGNSMYARRLQQLPWKSVEFRISGTLGNYMQLQVKTMIHIAT